MPTPVLVSSLQGHDLPHCVTAIVFSDMDYLFGVYCGILLASTAYFIIYAIAKCNQPVIYPKLIIPGLISGILWGIAMCKYIAVFCTCSIG